ncbi:MAG: phosphoribosylglycinamide formyltransferase [Proteobacteria bacterium]|nr:phosphoribosylglycinamide formyltransferase [Pseudomonadota bacterium]
MARLKIAVLISGRGSNMQALIEACSTEDAPAEIALVLSNVPDAAGLKFAEQNGIPTVTIDHRKFSERDSFEQKISSCLVDAKIELVCLAGFMRLLTAGFVDTWRDRLINIHPSLLPAFKGLDTHARVIAEGARFSGCTVHFVRSEMDSGPIIIQAAVPVALDDDADSLARRVLEAEHRIYPQALRLIAEGRVTVDNDLVRIEGARTPASSVINPDIGLEGQNPAPTTFTAMETRNHGD